MALRDAFRTAPALEVDLRRIEHTLVTVRWVGVAFGLFRMLLFPPTRSRNALAAWILLGVLALGNVLIDRSRANPDLDIRTVGRVSYGLDMVFLVGLTWLLAYDPTSNMWLALFLIAVEGGVRYQLPGALGGWVVIVVGYVAIGQYLEVVEGFVVPADVITFRAGTALVIGVTIGLLTRDLHVARERAEATAEDLRKVQEMRGRIVDTLAHDVRSPISVISMTLDTVRQGRASGPVADRLLEGAARHVARLETLVNDLLDMARSERGALTLDLEHANLRAVVDEAVSYLDVPGLEVDVPSDLTLVIDPERVEQVIVNLLTNAVRHGEPPVILRAQAVGDVVRIEVEDHGSGVAERDIPGLFDPFAVEGGDEASVGLGLWIIRELTEAHGGTVSYEPSQAGGARFCVELPRDGQSTTAAANGDD